MKKKAFNYIIFTLAFFSLFFSEKAFSANQELQCTSFYGSAGNETCYFDAITITQVIDGYSGIYPDTSGTHILGGGTGTLTSYNANSNGIIGTQNWWLLLTAGTETYYKQFYYINNLFTLENIDPSQATSTRITRINSPQNNTTSTSTYVMFNFDYFATGNDGYTVVGRELRNITTGFQFTTEEKNIIATGYSNYSTSTVLTQGNFHMWRAYIKNTNGNKIFSSWNSFNVVTASASSTSIELQEDLATSTKGFLQFLNVPELLKTKIPFAYFFQLVSTMQNLNQFASTTIPIGTFDWKWASGTPAESTLTIDLFSTSTISTFLTPTLTSILRTLMVVVTYFSTMWFLYHEAKRKHLLT